MAARRTTPKRRRKRGSANRKRRSPRRKLFAGAAAVVFVFAAALTVQLYVSVISRFDGRLWVLPSRVYSDRLVLEPGQRFEIEALTARLDRSGYARGERLPARPGQYRSRPGVLEIVTRQFEGASFPPSAGVVRVVFAGDRVELIRARDNAALRWLEVEPELLATMFGPRQEERVVTPLAEMPQVFIDAVLAAEDGRFYEHHGVDARAVARATWVNLRGGRITQGGSTITQQTVKNLFLGPQRTWWRKLREAPMSIILDLRYPKERILEVYLNEVYLGQRGPVAICGAQAAARFYFGRSLGELSLSEGALLAGLIRSPGTYNPFANPERSAARRNQVLDAMVLRGSIDPAAAERAKAESLRLASGGGGFTRAPYVVDFVRQELQESYPARALAEQGLRIVTTLDTAMQEAAERSLRGGIERLERGVPAVRKNMQRRTLQGALVVLDPGTGALLAMVGGRDYGDSQFNRAVQARRQPGSCFKPFVYLAGFENAVRGDDGALTPATVIEDSPVRLVSGGKPWSPENYDRQFRGSVTARQALEESLNVPTVKAAQHAGLNRIVDVARRAGIDSPLAALPSLPLGTIEVTPLELAAAYGTLAEQGRRVTPQIIREVRDSEGRPIESRASRRTQAVDPQAAYLVTDVLTGVFERGTGRSAARLGFRGIAAGKTGTTDETRDAWFVGYTPEIVALVWVGYDDAAKTGLTGATGALPIWADFMRRAGRAGSWSRFEPPAGILRIGIDPESGGAAVAGCPRESVEVFAKGTEPEPCELHGPRTRNWFRKLFRRNKGDRPRRPI